MIIGEVRFEPMRGYDTPIYYPDGRIGYADAIAVEMIQTGRARFGASLSPLTKEQEAMAPRGRTPAHASAAKELLTALKFVALAGTKDVQPFNMHAKLSGGWALAFDGQIAAGHPIKEELNCNPHLERLITAVTKCGNTLALTELDSGKLSVKGERLRALVPCLPDAEMSVMLPDPPVAPVNDNLKTAFAACGVLASEAATDMICASLLLEANVCTGTNRHAMIQFWHGIDLPPGLVVPKIFAAAVCRIKAPLQQFGYGWNTELQQFNSITLYFEGGFWLKTLLYNDRWPNVDAIMNYETLSVDTPAGFFDAVQSVSVFNDDGHVYISDGKVQSHDSAEEGAQIDVPGLVGNVVIQGKYVNYLAPYANKVDLTGRPERVFFFGENVRGVIMTIIENRAPVEDPDTQAYKADVAVNGGWASFKQ